MGDSRRGSGLSEIATPVDTHRVTWILSRLRASRDAGFTLVEVMVAIGMATVVLTGFAYASTSTVQAMHMARLNQQGADLATAQLEQMRTRSFGSLGHDPSGIAPDPHLSGGNYQGEPLVKVTGGLKPQISTTTQNGFAYTVYTYVTQIADVVGADNRRVTVIVEWAAYGATHSKVMSTTITQSARGLPLPEFKLTPVGPSTVTVNPTATAVFGFLLTNQGAPDQFNITTSLSGSTLYLDNGDGVYSEADTSLMTDHNGDGTPDTGRVEPKGSVGFWVVRVVPVDTPNSVTNWDVLATSATQASVSSSLRSVLVVTSAVITPSATPSPSASISSTPTPSSSPTVSSSPSPTSSSDVCEAAVSMPTPATVTGYSRKAYTLHNSGTTSWPTLPLPATGAIPGSTAKFPMYMDLAAVSIPASRDLPDFSTDLVPSSSGRLLYTGGSFASTSASQVLNFITQNAGRSYTGSVVLRLWVKPATSEESIALTAQLQTYKTNNGSTSAVGSASQVSFSDFECNGWQEVWWQFGGVSVAGANKTVLGVRIWNSGSHKVQVAYDHGLYPATFTVVEK